MKKYLELLFLKQLKGFGNVKIHKYLSLIEKSESLEILAQLIQENEIKITQEDILKAKNIAKEKYSRYTAQEDLKIVTLFDEEYPERFHILKEKKPVILYVKGNGKLLSAENMAVVGTREPSDFSVKMSDGLIRAIVRDSGRCIVSGLALGCDRLAHEGALKNNGTTIAVLPSGVNVITPSAHKNLAKSILSSGGCLVSEYDPDAKASKYTYIERDKLVASISDAVFVIQCGINSGTMHTVDAAYEFGRKTACYYTDIAARGDYSGNKYMIDKKGSHKVSGMGELHRFLDLIDKDKYENNVVYEQFDFSKFMNMPE